MAEQEQNRTEEATPFKLNEAKRRGQVAKSLDLTTAFVTCSLFAVLVVAGGSFWRELAKLCVYLFGSSASLSVTADTWGVIAGSLIAETAAVLWPLVAVGILVAILANVVQTGPVLSMEPLKPKFERLNPAEGFKRVFNKRILFEGFKSLLKLVVFGAILYGFFIALWLSLPAMGSGQLDAQLEWLRTNAVTLLVRLGAAMLIIGILDLLYSRWSYGKQMMMSRRELKEEIKRREGDPLIRAKIRELQRENVKQAKSMSRLPQADVLITNPEHLAIALQYDRERMNAPVVLAKGADNWAAQMRALANARDIPIFENRPLARLLFRRAQIDQAIPAESFLEVARIYAELNLRAKDRARLEMPA